ncbi:Eco57I restriction-modification methylase domain-containing protein [Sphingomonas sp. AX6]|uniref:Eco57I restriction-modification methylase domain-containing protein n=1 Tax=Sphingomonas sp. AX6 TaxID=2653171 RepID=UPI0012EFA1C8|nr:DNA methyltransferase [Sphingomonas sp. AX6]VXC84502.1 N-6 DNA Methylase [Sphingomonas sp. AX6]
MSDDRHDWLGHVQPTGLVVATAKLDELGLAPLPQHQSDSDAVKALLGEDERTLADAWAFLHCVLGWPADRVAGAPGGLELPEDLTISLRDGETVLAATHAVPTPNGEGWQLLVRVEAADVVLDKRGALDGWEATPHQRFERLLRETGVGAGVLIGARATGRQDDDPTEPELRLIVAPKGETSGWIAWPIASLATVAGRGMLGGLKMLLDRDALWTGAPQLRLPNVLAESRAAQADVSTRLSGQVLAALHELLRGFDASDPALVRALADRDPHQLYEGLLTILMRLIFILYAEDRGLMPSVTAHGGAELYERGYSVGGLFVKLSDDEALYPDTMDERRGAWGRLLALFRLIERGHPSGFMQARGGKLFDEAAFPFMLGKHGADDAERVLNVSDGCIQRVLGALMTLPNARTHERERLSYRTLDVEQIGSVYETVMGFTVDVATGPVLAIRAGKNNKVPVFVNLAVLLATAPGDRLKFLKAAADRDKFGRAAEQAIRDAETIADLVAAFDGAGAARSTAIDPRGSPRSEAAGEGTPILQPTDERRRTGSHYTPRSLTAPIVTHALEPAFERIGIDATPQSVLDLKLCDPAVGSGAFLVEACRQLGARLVEAWEAHPQLKPPIPPDEDDELHARRLVAQRCLYGVDRNPMALDLAKLSLWLVTLARDHEFSFLDHALKSGDSLVGLTRDQIEGASWEINAAPGLWRTRVRQDVSEALAHRDAIRNAPDEVALAMQEAQHERVERGLANVRLIGDAVIATFFAHGKAKARRDALAEVGDRAGSGDWAWLRQRALGLAGGVHPVRPFHWEIEFPEVFARDNPGFDSIVGNPPFAGKNTIIAGNRERYLDWLHALHSDAHGNADLSAHFYRRAFAALRESGAFGLIATNTIRQGDTRDSGLRRIIESGGSIYRAVRRHKWEGEAAVVVAMVFVVKDARERAVLDGRPARRISAYLVEGDLDSSPERLDSNSNKSFIGSFLLGMGFTFDEVHAAKGKATPLAEMSRLIETDPHNAEIIKPFLGGEEINNSPTFSHHRYTIDFFDRPLRREHEGVEWASLSEESRRAKLRVGVVAHDYRGEVAEDWPELIDIVRTKVKPERDSQTRDALRDRWWQFAEKRPGLYRTIENLPRVIAINCGATPHMSLAMLENSSVFSHTAAVFAFHSFGAFATLQCRVHEVWARFFGSSMKDDLRYTPSDCFETFPMPPHYDDAEGLEAKGRCYHDRRGALMQTRDQGMTPTYNRFHNSRDASEDIVELRDLHAAMDDAVLRAYGWDDLADRAAPAFLTEDTEDDHTYQGRLFWPAAFRDEVLARLLKLNEERAAEERLEGIA